MSRLSLDDVRVHRDSAEPARYQAHAFARGRDIHLAPGQDRHLAHEAWQVVQQAQGRVPATGQLEGGARLNEDVGLEREANRVAATAILQPVASSATPAGPGLSASGVLQRVIMGFEDFDDIDQIPETWVDAYIADMAVSRTHLFAEDIHNYLNGHVPAAARNAAELEYAPNHWDVRFNGKTVSTAADGDCGVHAIEAIRLGAAHVQDGYAAPMDRILAIRAVIAEIVATYPKDTIRGRILSEIQNCEAVAETGFGPALTARLQPIEQAAARADEADVGQVAAMLAGGAAAASGSQQPASAGGAAAASVASASRDAKAAAGAAADVKSGLAEGGPAPKKLVTKRETATHIGFEIEFGASYAVPIFAGYAKYTGKTLLCFAHDKRADWLQMLLDDPQVDGGVITFQVEFRTAPLSPAKINQETAKLMRGAIVGLHPANALRSGAALPVGWSRTADATSLIALVEAGGGKLAPGVKSFNPPGRIAQHVTSSINLAAFPLIPTAHQGLLYPAGAGAKTKLELYKSMMAAISQKPQLDASTTGRNAAHSMVKSPMESMLAAEILHETAEVDALLRLAQSWKKRPTSVALGTTGTMSIGDPIEGATAILAAGAYPTMQGQATHSAASGAAGEGPGGFLARSEKLQPPLLDTVDAQVRVLVEHRTNEIVAAANEALLGRPTEIWKQFVEAIRKMDAR
ncbi:hypothetical protein BH09PSE4_BH09PSE4_14580 [soil metagenome]